ncbi:hypothetical protein [Candidatus Venteria ishoeyi]|uniref:Uncharacterized protein n=1 Tax=Candidatus Venteria ishoeyi TaxID=1899563 RepID=A0A1H6F8D8_9GAMM|nr:hypothetical protein [Candidatus Venteria ishoeyi]SEH06388.1 Uncharacterised protein [Candidatus Venteria ishoeyi]SEH06389.1 Uncharacterised protein [Candidatus Venteria ishoeyi]
MLYQVNISYTGKAFQVSRIGYLKNKDGSDFCHFITPHYCEAAENAVNSNFIGANKKSKQLRRQLRKAEIARIIELDALGGI